MESNLDLFAVSDNAIHKATVPCLAPGHELAYSWTYKLTYLPLFQIEQSKKIDLQLQNRTPTQIQMPHTKFWRVYRYQLDHPTVFTCPQYRMYGFLGKKKGTLFAFFHVLDSLQCS